METHSGEDDVLDFGCHLVGWCVCTLVELKGPKMNDVFDVEVWGRKGE